MIYIVSGYMRTGTSLMMQALIAAGLDPTWSEEREKHLTKLDDDQYKINARGFYEIKLRKYKEPDFPLKYEGKLIKVMCWGLPLLYPHEYRIIFMVRPVEEIRQSWEAAFQRPMLIKAEEYEPLMDKFIAITRNRKDVVSFDLLQYAEVIEKPLDIFNSLDWPIDAIAAANTVNPKYYRFRLEALDVGISPF